MKILVDMNLSVRWIEHLVHAGFEAVHWSSVGPLNAPDSVLMHFAAEHDHVVITQDLDFSAILASSRRSKPSVVQIRADDLDPDVIAARVIHALKAAANELNSGALVTVDPVRTRLRLLPFPASSSQ